MLTTASLLTLAMQCAPSVHPDTISDIAKTESGFHPYAIAEIVPLKGGGSRVISHMPSSKDDAINIVEKIKKNKHRFSVGVMQITSTNFSIYNVNAEVMLNPCDNLSVAEKIILDCYKRGGTLKRALSCYYSGNFEAGQRSETSFGNTSYIQRIGYVVPSTRQDRQTSDKPEENKTTTVIYPDKIIRGNIPVNENSTVNHSYYAPQIVRGRLLTAQQKE
ncbi:transglycosylase (plasmid) [Buttiauxella sp. 3AFRM03]|uniref:lytic transglycosylase domain-containing protein n=1 Tax=Buttiauxella sp. 3AFRM03 TaxID=2479367 RepID=UPI000EF78C0B|nr:lytic transglycosylase domain-containing protein [Buttiauxella sp. 3AFRM03]AYN25683.1 transglycosylase [Buttiauxella sp. 3AFRM03]